MSAQAPLATCQRCGAHLSLDHLRGTDCPYCRTAFPHHARAVEHSAVVQRVMEQNMAALSPWLGGMPAFGAPPAAHARLAHSPLAHAHAMQAHLAHAQVVQTHLAMNGARRAVGLAIALCVGTVILGVTLSAVLAS